MWYDLQNILLYIDDFNLLDIVLIDVQQFNWLS